MKSNKDMGPKIDIIIPVYNALDKLKVCVDSIKCHTDLKTTRVIFVDDKSTDDNVRVYLRSLVSDSMVLIENDGNLGFSGSVNRGISYSDHDVILLNSDTIVTKGWVEKMEACAYSDQAIATVTPLSNNATICSIPVFCKKNEVPEGLTVDEYADIIEHCSFHAYPRITVAVGFCMYIKREVINVVGVFDQKSFGRGYGEENDFCFRAEQLGYHHVMCDDTYVFHDETASFQSEEKRRLIREHEKILLGRYPAQMKKNAEYIRNNPNQYIRDNIELYTKLRNGKRNILYVLHQDFREDASNNIGGTQFHVKDLMMQLRKFYNVFVAARDGSYLRVTAYTEKRRISFKFYIGEQPSYFAFFDKKLRTIFDDILNAFSIDIVHVHHVGTLSFDVFSVAESHQIPVVATLHDFYYDCPVVKLLQQGKRYCAGSSTDCKTCIYDQLGYAEAVDYKEYWQRQCRQVLEKCDILVTPSQSAKDIYASLIPELKDKICVIPHGMDDLRSKETFSFSEDICKELQFEVEKLESKNLRLSGWAYIKNFDNKFGNVDVLVKDRFGKMGKYHARKKIREDISAIENDSRYLNSGFEIFLPSGYFESGNLAVQIHIEIDGTHYYSRVVQLENYLKQDKKDKRVAFIGWLNEAKGSQLACGIMNAAGSRYEWFVIGGIADPDLYALEKDNLIKKDMYVREEVISTLQENQIDLVCILPIWPETFCYTLSEALLAGIPVLTTDLGAMGERMAGEKYGWIVSHDAKPEDILGKIDDIFADIEIYDQVKKKTSEYAHKTIKDMAAEYADLYDQLITGETPIRELGQFNAEEIYNGYARCNECKVQAIRSDNNLEQRVEELETKLRTVQGSFEYKVLQQLSSMNIPMKKYMLGFLRWGYRLYRRIGY